MVLKLWAASASALAWRELSVRTTLLAKSARCLLAACKCQLFFSRSQRQCMPAIVQGHGVVGGWQQRYWEHHYTTVRLMSPGWHGATCRKCSHRYRPWRANFCNSSSSQEHLVQVEQHLSLCVCLVL